MRRNEGSSQHNTFVRQSHGYDFPGLNTFLFEGTIPALVTFNPEGMRRIAFSVPMEYAFPQKFQNEREKRGLRCSLVKKKLDCYE